MEFTHLFLLALFLLGVVGSNGSKSREEYWKFVLPDTLSDLLQSESESNEPIKVEEEKQYWTVFFEHDLYPGKIMRLGVHKHSDIQPLQSTTRQSVRKTSQTFGVGEWLKAHTQDEKMNQPFGARTWGAKDSQPFGARTWGGKETQPFGARTWGAKENQPFGARTWGGKESQPFGARTWGAKESQPFGARTWGAKESQPFGARTWGAKESHPFGARTWGGKENQPFGARTWGGKESQPFGARTWGAKESHPFGARTWGGKENQPFGAHTWLKAHGKEEGHHLGGHSMNEKDRESLNSYCATPSAIGEDKYCAPSLESMIDFAISKLGKNIKMISSSFAKNQDEYVIEEVKKLGDKAVMCHRLNFKKVVFYCHQVNATTAFIVPLVSSDGTKSKALTICHHDTRGMDPKVLYDVLKVKPGTIPVCHFVGNKAIAWVPNDDVNEHDEHPCVI